MGVQAHHLSSTLSFYIMVSGLKIASMHYHAWLQTAFEYSFGYIPQSGITMVVTVACVIF